MTNEEAAQMLFEAMTTKQGVKPLSEQKPDLNVDDAYKIQLINVERQLKNDKVTGKKIGLTSKPMQEMFNVNEPDYGHIYASKEVKNNKLKASDFLWPRVEAEIAFVMKEDLIKDNITAEDVIKATDYVVAAFEIVDSRIDNWKIKLVDTVADNASFGAYQIGSIKKELKDIDLIAESMVFTLNGEEVGQGNGSAVLGNPITCVVWLANKLAGYGVYLNKGDVVLSGALSKAIDAKAKDKFKVEFSSLGSLELEFE